MKSMDLWDVLGDLPEEDVTWMLNYEPPHKRTVFLVSKPFLAGVSTAACLLLIVGVGVGVWSRQQRIEPLPPQTTTVTQTETRTETTEQVMTESQTTTVTQTETSRKAPESTTISAIFTDQGQPSTSEAALLTTVSPTETITATTITRQANAITISTQQNNPPAVNTRIAPPQTSVTARIQGQIAPITEQSARTTPVTTTVIITPTQPRTDPTESSCSTEPLKTDLTETSYTGMTVITTPKDTAMTEPRITDTLEPTVPTDPDTKTDVFSGFCFTIEKLTDVFWRIYPMPEDDDPNDFSLQYGIEGTSLIEVDGPFFDRRSIRFRREEDGKEISVSQTLRSSFYFDYYSNDRETIIAWGDCPGFIREGSNGWCSCIWDDGNYIMVAGCYKEDIPLLKTLHVIND